jgi:hypothetical protein
MADVAVGHEKIIVADLGPHRMSSAAMNGYLFAKDVAITDFGESRLIVVFKVLRLFPEDGAGINHVPPAHGQRAAHQSMGPEHAIPADAYLSFDDRMSTDHDIVSQFGFWGNDGRRMNARRLIGGHSCSLFPDRKPKMAMKRYSGPRVRTYLYEKNGLRIQSIFLPECAVFADCPIRTSMPSIWDW